jgi:hypothetical protein
MGGFDSVIAATAAKGDADEVIGIRNDESQILRV